MPTNSELLKLKELFVEFPAVPPVSCAGCGDRGRFSPRTRLVPEANTGYPKPYCFECFKSQQHELRGICPECERIHNIWNFVFFDGKYICRNCYHNQHWGCAVCHNLYHNSVESNVATFNGIEYKLCPQCYESGRYLIHDYSYNPDFKFYKTEKDKKTLLYFGIELEVESMGNNKTEVIKQLPDFVYVKSDSSIHNGFEIVSHPMSYSWLRVNEDKWNSILELRKKGWRSFQTDTCGMHVHISKIAFGSYHLYKFMRMFYNNPSFILKISQRNSGDLRDWAANEDSERNLIYKARTKEQTGSGRHTAVNLSREDSVEIRIFKGTLCPPSFWKNIEFVKALYDFSLNHTALQMNEVDFRNYLRFKRKEYPNLHDFLWGEKYRERNKKLSYSIEE